MFRTYQEKKFHFQKNGRDHFNKTGSAQVSHFIHHWHGDRIQHGLHWAPSSRSFESFWAFGSELGFYCSWLGPRHQCNSGKIAARILRGHGAADTGRATRCPASRSVTMSCTASGSASQIIFYLGNGTTLSISRWLVGLVYVCYSWGTGASDGIRCVSYYDCFRLSVFLTFANVVLGIRCLLINFELCICNVDWYTRHCFHRVRVLSEILRMDIFLISVDFMNALDMMLQIVLDLFCFFSYV